MDSKENKEADKINTRTFKCTGCGEDRPCFLETNQEPNPLDEIENLFTEDLKCVLDSTNQTSYNWKEVPITLNNK